MWLVPLSALRGQRVLLPSLRQDLFSPLGDACAREGFAPNAEIGPSFYQAYYLVQEQLCTCLLYTSQADQRYRQDQHRLHLHQPAA